MPLARSGPTSIENERCNRASPRKSARSVLIRLFIAAFYVVLRLKAWGRRLREPAEPMLLLVQVSARGYCLTVVSRGYTTITVNTWRHG